MKKEKKTLRLQRKWLWLRGKIFRGECPRFDPPHFQVMTMDGAQTILMESKSSGFKNSNSWDRWCRRKKVAPITEVHSGIGQTTVEFIALKWCLWKGANLSTKTNICLFQILILPILLWTLLQSDINKLKSLVETDPGHLAL